MCLSNLALQYLHKQPEPSFTIYYHAASPSLCCTQEELLSWKTGDKAAFTFMSFLPCGTFTRMLVDHNTENECIKRQV